MDEGDGTSCTNTRNASSRAGRNRRRKPTRTICSAPGAIVAIGGVASASPVGAYTSSSSACDHAWIDVCTTTGSVPVLRIVIASDVLSPPSCT